MSERRWLWQLRVEKGMTQADLAADSGVSQEMIHYLEAGKRAPKPKLAQQIGRLLGFDWTKFYEEGEMTDEK